VPILKGTWLISPYKEDRAGVWNSATPLDQWTNPSAELDDFTESQGAGGVNGRPRPAPDFRFSKPLKPGFGYANQTGTIGHDGYFIDDNTFGLTGGFRPATDDHGLATKNQFGIWYRDQRAGYGPSLVMPLTVNHITETDTQFGGLCLQCHTQTALKTAWPGHGTVKGWGGATKDLITSSVASRMHNMKDLKSAQEGNYASGYRWGMDPINQRTNGYIQTDYHQFPCSKCHTPHASSLPRMLSTNCLNITHASANTKRTSQGATNCHNSTRGFWNTKTAW
jgi:hypothetical protein